MAAIRIGAPQQVCTAVGAVLAEWKTRRLLGQASREELLVAACRALDTAAARGVFTSRAEGTSPG